jgi:hypothetical protein
MAKKPETDGEAKVGRPSTYSEETADAICVELMAGRSLVEICEQDDMPAERTVYVWLLKHPEFVRKYAHAREMQAERGIDEIIPIADDGRNDWMERVNSDGTFIGWMENGEAMRRSQIRIDARKWKASKLRPKVYGDKLAIGGDDTAPPVRLEMVKRVIVDPRDTNG